MQQKRAIPHFSAACSKFCGKRRIPRRDVKIRLPQNIVSPAQQEGERDYSR